MTEGKSEHREQVDVVSWFQKAWPKLKKRLYAIPNGTNKSLRQASWYKAEGLRPGVPDLHLPLPLSGYPGLFIEMKRAKGYSVSKDQKDWIAYLKSVGYRVEVCKGAEEAKVALNDYLIKGLSHLKGLKTLTEVEKARLALLIK